MYYYYLFTHIILIVTRNKSSFIFQGEEGCGTLLFETIKGVSGKLHSCTQSFLTDVVTCLAEQSVDTQCLARVLSFTLSLLISELDPEHCAVVWTILHVNIVSSHWETQASVRLYGHPYLFIYFITTKIHKTCKIKRSKVK